MILPFLKALEDVEREAASGFRFWVSRLGFQFSSAPESWSTLLETSERCLKMEYPED